MPNVILSGGKEVSKMLTVVASQCGKKFIASICFFFFLIWLFYYT